MDTAFRDATVRRKVHHRAEAKGAAGQLTATEPKAEARTSEHWENGKCTEEALLRREHSTNVEPVGRTSVCSCPFKSQNRGAGKSRKDPGMYAIA